jgi:NAD+ kinase
MHSIGIIANINKPVIKAALETFFSGIDLNRYKIFVGQEIHQTGVKLPPAIECVDIATMLKSVQLITSFGGDGTLLHTAQIIGKYEVPILGIKLGGLGFLTSSSIEKAWVHINAYFQGKLNVEQRSVLKLNVDQLPPCYFLNDFVIDKAGFSRLITIRTEVAGHLLNSYLADGIIISTPTGSTAYSLANGGPIVAPSTNSFIINPICPHTLSNRPIIISDEFEITIHIESDHGKFNIFGDGQMIGTFPLQTEIVLQKAEYYVRLVQTPGHEFFTILREKLGWGEIKYKPNS